MIDLLDPSYTLPHRIDSIKPNLMRIHQSVVVNMEFPDLWDDLLGRIRKILGGCGGIPRCVGGRAAGKLTPLLYRDNRRSCVL
jgi:hypothetical protein